MAPSKGTREVIPVRVGDLTDWSGQLLQKKALQFVQPGCVVRVIMEYKDGGEALYYRINKVKDGTYWGTCLDTYRLCSCGWEDAWGKCGCHEGPIKDGQETTFRAHHISELPISWQPKSVQKKLKQFLIPEKGYAVTGVRAGLI